MFQFPARTVTAKGTAAFATKPYPGHLPSGWNALTGDAPTPCKPQTMVFWSHGP
jgi:hypothetical protein